MRISVNFNANESFPSLELWAPLPPPSKPFFSLHLVSSFCRQWPSLRPQHSLSLLGPRGLPHRSSSRQSSQLCSSPLEGMPSPSSKIRIGKTEYSKKACVEISCLAPIEGRLCQLIIQDSIENAQILYFKICPSSTQRTNFQTSAPPLARRAALEDRLARTLAARLRAT